jgi:hypothetical protein
MVRSYLNQVNQLLLILEMRIIKPLRQLRKLLEAYIKEDSGFS